MTLAGETTIGQVTTIRAPTTTSAAGPGLWSRWARGATAALAACWQRFRRLFVTPPSPAEARSAERRRRKEIRRKLRNGETDVAKRTLVR